MKHISILAIACVFASMGTVAAADTGPPVSKTEQTGKAQAFTFETPTTVNFEVADLHCETVILEASAQGTNFVEAVATATVAAPKEVAVWNARLCSLPAESFTSTRCNPLYLLASRYNEPLKTCSEPLKTYRGPLILKAVWLEQIKQC
jgi:hypothetical protein